MARALVKTVGKAAFITGPAQPNTNLVWSGGSFVPISGSPDFTFTPTVSGRYKIYINDMPPWGANGSPGASASMKIVNTVGGATIFSQPVDFNGTGAATTFVSSPVTMLADLTAGVLYTFQLQATSNAGTGEMLSDSSHFWIAEQVLI